MNTKTKQMSKKKVQRIVKYILLILAAFLVTLFLVYFIMVSRGKAQLKKPIPLGEENAEETGVSTQEIFWNGDVYEYREDLITILCLGIDGRGEAEENTDFGFGPRADSIYLAVLDLEQEKVTLLNISRDSMANVHLFDSLGQDTGFCQMQIGIQYANGDGLEGSCQLMAETVSGFLNGVPINGYCALYWNGIGALQEQIGSLTLPVSEELKELDSKRFKESGLVELNSEQIMVYVQGRDIQVSGSNEERTGRQREYLQALYTKVKAKLKKNPFSIFSLWNTVSPYLVTNMTPSEVLALQSWVSDWNMEEIEIRSFAGEYVYGDFQDEYWVDEEQKEELLIELFYKKRY